LLHRGPDELKINLSTVLENTGWVRAFPLSD